jgi:hypothetical protein
VTLGWGSSPPPSAVPRSEAAGRADRSNPVYCGWLSTGCGISHSRFWLDPPLRRVASFKLAQIERRSGCIRERWPRSACPPLGLRETLSGSAAQTRLADLERRPEVQSYSQRVPLAMLDGTDDRVLPSSAGTEEPDKSPVKLCHREQRSAARRSAASLIYSILKPLEGREPESLPAKLFARRRFQKRFHHEQAGRNAISPACTKVSTSRYFSNGAYRDRTDGLQLANSRRPFAPVRRGSLERLKYRVCDRSC